MTPPNTIKETEGIRLSKRVADILKCSRTEAEQVIVGGWVKVNEVVVDEPAHRVSLENIEIHSTAQRGKVPLLTVIWPGLAQALSSNGQPSGVWRPYRGWPSRLSQFSTGPVLRITRSS